MDILHDVEEMMYSASMTTGADGKQIHWGLDTIKVSTKKLEDAFDSDHPGEVINSVLGVIHANAGLFHRS